jgi:hypothetical protein
MLKKGYKLYLITCSHRDCISQGGFIYILNKKEAEMFLQAHVNALHFAKMEVLQKGIDEQEPLR